MTRNLALEQSWRVRIEECRQSGLSVKKWCLQNGLKNTSYHYWIKKFRILDQQEAEDNTFAEVVLLPENKNTTKCSPRGSRSVGDWYFPHFPQFVESL
ncbi:IS66 family insertion sequence element accessory protein TnpA [Desulfosporosinus sp. BICA1-9]|uniref:IS66 family insertion sequence element accessory protein TnpA n=1 Tax=Desulfosporosinus sp. BICA1-9 TaxID=1531958 RepID=UPI0025BFB7B3|nr:hypothetical protein [Desulfosporosinus sp. BICA1-9]